MVNEVFLAGEVVGVKKLEKAVEAEVHVQRRGRGGTVQTDKFNVQFNVGENFIKSFELYKKNKKPMYISLRGVLAAKKIDDSDKYRGHIYILARDIGPIGVKTDMMFARAVIGGNILYSEVKFRSNGTEYRRMLIRNVRALNDMTFSTSVSVTVWDVNSLDDADELMEKGRDVIVTGRLESYESRDNPGVFVTTLVADEVYPTVFPVSNEQEKASNTEKKEEKKGNKEENELDFDELPF